MSVCMRMRAKRGGWVMGMRMSVRKRAVGVESAKREKVGACMGILLL